MELAIKNSLPQIAFTDEEWFAMIVLLSVEMANYKKKDCFFSEILKKANNLTMWWNYENYKQFKFESPCM